MGCCTTVKNASRKSEEGSQKKRMTTVTGTSKVKSLSKNSNLTDRSAKIEMYYH